LTESKIVDVEVGMEVERWWWSGGSGGGCGGGWWWTPTFSWIFRGHPLFPTFIIHTYNSESWQASWAGCDGYLPGYLPHP